MERPSSSFSRRSQSLSSGPARRPSLNGDSSSEFQNRTQSYNESRSNSIGRSVPGSLKRNKSLPNHLPQRGSPLVQVDGWWATSESVRKKEADGARRINLATRTKELLQSRRKIREKMEKKLIRREKKVQKAEASLGAMLIQSGPKHFTYLDNHDDKVAADSEPTGLPTENKLHAYVKSSGMKKPVEVFFEKRMAEVMAEREATMQERHRITSEMKAAAINIEARERDATEKKATADSIKARERADGGKKAAVDNINPAERDAAERKAAADNIQARERDAAEKKAAADNIQARERDAAEKKAIPDNIKPRERDAAEKKDAANNIKARERDAAEKNAAADNIKAMERDAAEKKAATDNIQARERDAAEKKAVADNIEARKRDAAEKKAVTDNIQARERDGAEKRASHKSSSFTESNITSKPKFTRAASIHVVSSADKVSTPPAVTRRSSFTSSVSAKLTPAQRKLAKAKKEQLAREAKSAKEAEAAQARALVRAHSEAVLEKDRKAAENKAAHKV